MSEEAMLIAGDIGRTKTDLAIYSIASGRPLAQSDGQSLMLSTASLRALGYENSISRLAIALWNDTHHVLKANEKEDSPGICEHRQFATNEVTR